MNIILIASWRRLYNIFSFVRMKPGDVGVERTKFSEGAGTVSTLELVLILYIVDTAYVSPEVASLGELHGAETARVGFLTSVLQTVALHTLFLSESPAALLAFIRPDTCVNALMSGNLRRLQEFLTAVLAA